MLNRESWWPAAEHLNEGQSRRVPHDCGEGRTLLVSRNADGYRAWCFRCNDGGSAGPPAESVADKLERLARQRAGDGALPHAALPEPRVVSVDDWPRGAVAWLYRAGISRADIGQLGIYWHAGSDRVVLPHGSYYQARAWQAGRQPKYVGPTPKPGNLLCTWGQAERPTLTEDMLSSIKIGLAGCEGWAVLGTTVSAHMVGALMKRGTAVNVWLDPDAAGQRGAGKIIKQLRAYGVECRNIVSVRDPKLHTRAEIKEYLR